MSVVSFRVNQVKKTPFDVMLAMPLGTRQVDDEAKEAWSMWYSCQPEWFDVIHAKSLGGLNQTDLWVHALNQRKNGLTHFLMQHSDVVPQKYFMDPMWRTMKETGCHVLAAVIGMKDRTKMTSIGISKRGTGVARKLKINEVLKLPDPFSTKDVDPTGESILCINTGLMLCDMRPIVKEHYTFDWQSLLTWYGTGGIKEADDGSYHTQFTSEDYKESFKLGEMPEVKVMATHCLDIVHHGDYAYPNKPDGGLL